jgi:hypothetical protein
MCPMLYVWVSGWTNKLNYKLIEALFNAWNKKKYIAGIYCDLTKAFEGVNHELVLSKLKFYGVRSLILEWLKSYQYNRKQRVDLEFIKTHYYSSGWEIVKCGVLQGCVLRLWLFNIYMNDFPKIINKLSCTLLFADDKCFLVTSSNYSYLT